MKCDENRFFSQTHLVTLDSSNLCEYSPQQAAVRVQALLQKEGSSPLVDVAKRHRRKVDLIKHCPGNPSRGAMSP
jgi:hypothetical protein